MTSVVPASLKSAMVKPLHKKPNHDQGSRNNYRPILCLPFFSKLLEKTVSQQLSGYLLNSNLLQPFQSASRACHSTETPLAKVVNDILLSLDFKLHFSSSVTRSQRCVWHHRSWHIVGLTWKSIWHLWPGSHLATILSVWKNKMCLLTIMLHQYLLTFNSTELCCLPFALLFIYLTSWPNYSEVWNTFPLLCRWHSLYVHIKADDKSNSDKT